MRKNSQIGATATEVLIVLPIVILLGMIGVQYALMYNAKSNLTYASYEAARAGAIHNADPEKIQHGLIKGLLPYLISDSNVKMSNNAIANAALMQSNIEKIKLKEANYMKVEIISPNKEAFEDFSDTTGVLGHQLKTNNKVIPNKQSDIEKLKGQIGQKSGITIEEANVLKLRITYGYKPSIPLAKNMFVSVQNFLMGEQNVFNASLLASDRIPIVVDVSAQMLSPAVENGLQTTAYKPPRGELPSISSDKLPDIAGISLPDNYKDLTPEELIAIINGETDVGAGQIGVNTKDKKDILAWLVAAGVAGTAIMNSGGGSTNTGVVGDFGLGANTCTN